MVVYTRNWCSSTSAVHGLVLVEAIEMHGTV